MGYEAIILWVFAVIGFITAVIELLKALGKLFESISLFYVKIKVYVWYPIVIRLNKKKHKKYIEEYFNELLFHNPIELPLEIGKVKIQWSDEESVKADLEKDLLLVRVEYAGEVERTLAKVAFFTAPYMVSLYLEPALGEEFSRLVSIGVVENFLQDRPPVLARFRELIDEAFGGKAEYKYLLSLITKADDTSLYRHVFLYELRKILREFGARVDKCKLTDELKKLIEVVANLDSISVPKVCGYYVNITIVRAGKMVKVVLKEWESYVNFIRNLSGVCHNLQRVYIVSAGDFTSKATKELLKYLEANIPGLSLIDKFEYKARYYKGRPNVPRLVAVMEFK